MRRNVAQAFSEETTMSEPGKPDRSSLLLSWKNFAVETSRRDVLTILLNIYQI